MYKFTNHISNAKLILVRRHLDGSNAALVLLHRPQRVYSTKQKIQCEADAGPPKSNRLFWGLVGATVFTGAAVVYATSSPDARNWLETNAPWANDFVALVNQENTTYYKAAANQFNKGTIWLSQFLFGKEGVTPPDIPQRSAQDMEKELAISFGKKEYELPPPTFEPLYIKEKVIDPPEVETEATLVHTEKCEPTPPPTIKITKDMVEIEHEMHENTKLAVDNYKAATKHCIAYNKSLFTIIESDLDDLDKKYFASLQGALTERENTYKKAKDAGAKARCAIETLDRMIKAGVQAPPESIAATKRYLVQFRKDLDEVETSYKKEVQNAVLTEKYWSKVEEARRTFKDELEALFPGIDLCAKTLELKGDTDLLLMYTLKRVQYLQNEIAKLQTVRELQINRAIECHDEKAIIEAKVEDIIQNEKLGKEKEYLKKSLEVQAAANRHIKEELKKQFQLQQDILQDRLKKKEQAIMGNFNRAVSEQVEKERVVFKKELAAMAGKLQAIEQTLKQRAAGEAEARRSQSLWAAAEALLAATRRPGPSARVDNELKALQKAGKNDKLVETVLKGISKEIHEKGIVTEKALRDRFETMENTARKVALIGREGAALPVYFLSWLQSKLLFVKNSDIPQDELDNLPTDFSKLDTFEIIQRARYHMEHGNLPGALRYVNLLQGAARAASRGWAEAARAHLELRQAAEAVMAHASVTGLLYL
ncbi:unnamed protein product [Arctia plantaginis]|uniref:MICOS complex subunit MIC60 n=1 Tax=Arctia plantaginis TaxID=874455 RepID=A0A8S0Z472_ARCPL|nr:unnamed protein product [Arctia plantaginis]